LGLELGWRQHVKDVLNNCIAYRHSPSYWKDIFKLEKCGSGTDLEVRGWITNLFAAMPRMAYISNFPTCLSTLEYKNTSVDKRFMMADGLLYSTEQDGLLVPNFSYLVYEVNEQERNIHI
jgi:hypothetical protein